MIETIAVFFIVRALGNRAGKVARGAVKAAGGGEVLQTVAEGAARLVTGQLFGTSGHHSNNNN